MAFVFRSHPSPPRFDSREQRASKAAFLVRQAGERQNQLKGTHQPAHEAFREGGCAVPGQQPQANHSQHHRALRRQEQERGQLPQNVVESDPEVHSHLIVGDVSVHLTPAYATLQPLHSLNAPDLYFPAA